MSAIELLYLNALDNPAKNIAVMNAHAHPLLNKICSSVNSCQLQQHYKPAYDALVKSGLKIVTKLQSGVTFDLILILPSKNRQQTRAWMADARQRLNSGGKIMMACANSHGAKGYESALKKLMGNISSSSKSKCRIFSARKTSELNNQLADQWIADGNAHDVDTLGLRSRPGLFSWDRPDSGSLLLLSQVPELSGTGMDLCCGYGLLSEQGLRRSEKIICINMIDAHHLALECAETKRTQWNERVELH